MTKADLIIQSVEIYRGVTLLEMQQRTRKETICDARRFVCAIIHELAKESLEKTAYRLNLVTKAGRGDHSVVFKYIRTDKDFCENNKAYRKDRQEIVDRVNRLFIPDITPASAWNNLWKGINHQALAA